GARFLDELAASLEALIGGLRESASDYRIDCLGDTRIAPARSGRLVVQVCKQRRGGGVPLERRDTRQTFVKQTAEGVDICATVDVARLDLFRRNVFDRTHQAFSATTCLLLVHSTAEA